MKFKSYWALLARFCFLLFFIPNICVVVVKAASDGNPKDSVSYYNDILPIFQAHCHGCHQPAKDKGGYVMTDFKRLLKGGESEEPAIVPGHPELSQLLTMVTPVDGIADMPKKGENLNETQVALIRNWIVQGAQDDSPPNSQRLYDMENPPRYTLPPMITALDFSPDGKLLAVSGSHEVLLYDAAGTRLLGRLVGLSQRIESIRFSPDGSLLAVTGGLSARMGEVQIWEVDQQQLKLSVPVTYDTVYGASWSPDGKLVAFGCADQTVRAIEASSGEEVLFQGSHDDWVLDTVFSLKGDHVVSVGRDQTAKLTELATQRFIDNITSITPGALKGGIQSVARHPSREEILVGGSDGVPQVYRIFRESKRVIGDNANLVRKFPPMEGRIFSVAYGPEGKWIAAASSLDGAGRLNVYSSDFDSTLSEELKKVLEKVSTSRSQEENALVEQYQTSDVNLLGSALLPCGVYSLAIHPDGNVIATGGSDGVVRIFDSKSVFVLRAFVPAPVERKPENADPIMTLSVSPTEIELNQEFDYAQLVVTAWTAGGESRDVTRAAGYDVSQNLASITDQGKVTPKNNGQGNLRVRFEGRDLVVPIRVSGLDQEFVADYIRDVMPVLSHLGCNAGTCHGSKDGKNGFKLSLRGYDPLFDVRALTDDLAGRRVNYAFPDESLMLLKATGAVPHEGGQRTRPDESYYKILRAWIAQGGNLDLSTPRVESIQIVPSNPVVQQIGDQQQFRVVARYTDGARRDVTTEAFIESGNTEICKAGTGGLVETLRRGEAPVLARFEGAYAATTLTVMGDRAEFVWEEPPKFNPVDEFIAAKWKRMKIQPSELCKDETFVRRVHLDLTGLPPTVETVRSFLADSRETRIKREELIDQLVGSEAFIDYWANKWADLLQVNRKYLGAEGAALFRDWIRKEISDNTPYDEFAKKILAASGSNRENPAASYYKVLRSPDEIMENTTHLFLATRFNCNKCHDHPFERWTQDQYYETAAFFARVGFKKDPESGDRRVEGTAVESSKPLYEIVYDKEDGEVVHDRTGKVTAPQFPFPASYNATEEMTRREKLARWMVAEDNPYFAKSYVNRMWGYLLGRGMIEPIDDIRAGNPPSHPELLGWLTDEFKNSGFDVRHLIRTICKSRTYQLSIETNRWNKDDEVNFSHALPKRLPAEVLYDAIYYTTGAKSEFPGLPPGTRATQLPDAGVKLEDGFLANLGRPPRESACECERSDDLQLGSIMALVSGPTVDKAITDPDNAIADLVRSESNNEKVVEELFLRILNRPAREKERDSVLTAFHDIEHTHQELVAELATYRSKIAPLLAEKNAEHERQIQQAEQELESYQEEIAPREAELDRQQKEKISAAETELSAYEETLPSALEQWAGNPDRATQWSVLQLATLKAGNGSSLNLEEDGSVFASGENGQGVYEVTAFARMPNITGIKIEALTDDRLPKKGPGRAEDDGNFVLSEFEAFWAPASDPSQQTQLDLENARADFSQVKYDVATAIDGKIPDADNGWAIAPKTGEGHMAVFEIKKPLDVKEGILLTFKLHQNYKSKLHSLGRFRILVSSDAKPLDLGVPMEIETILATVPDERTAEQQDVLMTYFKSIDARYQELAKALEEAKKPRPVDPKLKELQDRLEAIRQPLPEDPGLKALERAVQLSEKQLENKRLVAAQDIAWALINNPAFLFNH